MEVVESGVCFAAVGAVADPVRRMSVVGPALLYQAAASLAEGVGTTGYRPLGLGFLVGFEKIDLGQP